MFDSERACAFSENAKPKKKRREKEKKNIFVDLDAKLQIITLVKHTFICSPSSRVLQWDTTDVCIARSFAFPLYNRAHIRKEYSACTRRLR